jgi:serine/threonine-protein kinase RsbW
MILEFIAVVCLDSKCIKPITYKAYIVSELREIKLPSRLESVEEAATKVAEFVAERGLADEITYAVDMAVRESVANAVKHGNKFDESKNVELTLEDSEDGFGITVRDFGEGFSVDEVPDPTNPENLLKTNGRGILFMNSFMDEVDWSNASDGGLIVKMKKLKV